MAKQTVVVTKREEKDLEAWITTMAPQILDGLGIGMVNINTTYSKETKKRGMNIAFTMKYSIRYKTMVLAYNENTLAMFRGGEEKKLFDALVHEMCHIITEPLAELAESRYVTPDQVDEKTEELTEHIAMLVRETIYKEINK